MKDWGHQPNPIAGNSKNDGVLLYKAHDGQLESGLWQVTPGTWPLEIPRDELCHFVSGRATYTRDSGEVVDVVPDTVVLFPAGWKGMCTVHQTLRNVYMLSATMTPKLSSSAPHLVHPHEFAGPFKDWGVIPTKIDGESTTSGMLFHKGPNGENEAGIWICTPGYWNCHVTRDEFCHFLLGRCTYTHESGEVIEIVPGTAAFFPKGWKGTCRVHETVRKVYMIG